MMGVIVKVGEVMMVLMVVIVTVEEVMVVVMVMVRVLCMQLWMVMT